MRRMISHKAGAKQAGQTGNGPKDKLVIKQGLTGLFPLATNSYNDFPLCLDIILYWRSGTFIFIA